MPLENQFYLPFVCAACGTRQRVYNGDPDDLTLPDFEAVKCYRCSSCELTDKESFTDPECRLTRVGVPYHIPPRGPTSEDQGRAPARPTGG